MEHCKSGTFLQYDFLFICLQYRTPKNYLNPTFMGPRILDKTLISILMMTLYWKIGSRRDEDNISNINGILFMWTEIPAFGAAPYIPSLMLGAAYLMEVQGHQNGA